MRAGAGEANKKRPDAGGTPGSGRFRVRKTLRRAPASAPFRRLAAYLKPGGTLIFSWNHPLYGRAGCVYVQGDRLVFDKSYFDRRDTEFTFDDGVLYLRNYSISDYVNALADAGFAIERLVEQTDAETLAASGDLTDKMRQAQMHPLSFVFKARKL